MNPIVQVAAVTTAIGRIGGGALYLNAAHAPISIVADPTVSRILELEDRAKAEPVSPWLCKAIDEELYRFCLRNEQHYLCRPDTVRDIKRKAGCLHE